MGRKKHHLKETPKSDLTANHIKLLQLADKLILLSSVAVSPNISKILEHQVEIHDLVYEIQCLEQENESPTSCRSNTSLMNRFTNWLNENDAKFKDIEIAEFPDLDFGLKTGVDIEDSSLIMTIPRDLMITVENAKSSSLGPLIETDPLLNNMPNVALALFLLLEKFKGNSFWKPYIDILPNTFSSILYFNIEELKELQGSPTLEIALKQIKNVGRQYAYFYKLIWSLENPACRLLRKHFTFNQYRWAVSTIMTRQNTIPSEDGLQTINALIPLWDFCNHENGKIKTSYNLVLKCCECFALRNFKAGEQIFIFYGARTNAELFIHNGFICEDNENDSYLLHLGISKSDTLKEERIKVLSRLSLPDNGEFCLKGGSQPVSGQLLAFLRIFNMDKEKLLEWQEKDNPYHLEDTKLVFDLEFEKKYWTFIVNRFKLLLAMYKTNLEQDLAFIKSNTLTPNCLLACKMRASEKKLLENAIKYVDQHLNVCAMESSFSANLNCAS